MTDQQDLRALLAEALEHIPKPTGSNVERYKRLVDIRDRIEIALREAAAQLGRAGGRASVDEVHAWAERHDITGQYLVAAYEDAAASQLPAGVPDGFYLKLLVAAGHITQEVANKTRDIAVSVLAASPQTDSEESK